MAGKHSDKEKRKRELLEEGKTRKLRQAARRARIVAQIERLQAAQKGDWKKWREDQISRLRAQERNL